MKAIWLIFGVGVATIPAHAQKQWDGYVAPGHYWKGAVCKEDGCLGHKAGYAWAESHDIADEDECASDSPSFEAGCLMYVEEHNDEPTLDDYMQSGDLD